MSRYCIYSRKSKATEKGESIDNQIQACKDYIQRLDRHVNLDKDVDVYIDDGFSGKNVNRPQFQQMVARIKKRQYTALVCYRLDRISRNVCDFVVSINEFSKYGVSFMSVNEGFDTSTPMGRTMMYIASIFAEMERETIAERVRDNMYALAFTGRWLGGRTPYGFNSERISYQSRNGATKYQSILVPNDDELKIVELLFNKYIEVGALVSLQKLLAQSGIRNRMGRNFSDTAIKSILTNPTYCCADKDAYEYFSGKGSLLPDDAERLFDGEHGIMTFNRHDGANGNMLLRPINEWIIAIGDHEGVIPGWLFVKVQNLLEENRLRYENSYSYAENDYALLSGRIFCRKCGSRMFTQRNAAKGYFAYICDTRKTFGINECDCKYLNGRAVDSMVMDELLKFDVDGSRIKQALLEMADEKVQRLRAQSMIDVYKDQIAEKKAAIKSLVMKLATGELNEVVADYINEQITTLDAEIKELESHVDAEREVDEKITSSTERVEHYLKVLSDLRNMTDLESKRAAIRQVVDRVEWDGENVELFYKWGA